MSLPCELEMSFSFGKIVSLSLLPVSPRQCSTCFSPQWLLSYPTPHGLFHLDILLLIPSLPHPRQRGNIPSMVLAISFVHRGCNQLHNCVRICGSLPVCCTHLLGLQIAWLKMNQLQGSICRWQTKVFCLLLFDGS
jgi:hypothetical protein